MEKTRDDCIISRKGLRLREVLGEVGASQGRALTRQQWREEGMVA